MAFGQSRGDEIMSREPSIAARGRWRRRHRRGISLVAKIRLGALLGLVSVVATPLDLDSLGGVGRQVFGGQHDIDQANAPRLGNELPSTSASGSVEERQHTDRSAEGYENVLRGQVTQALTRQSTALRAGDLGGFLSIVDQGNAALRAELSRRFASLQAMKVAGWEENLSGTLSQSSDGTWGTTVRLRYCFVVAGCTSVPITVATRWSVTGKQVLLTAFGSSSADQVGPRPWEVSELRAAVGARVVVAGTNRWAGKLPEILASAEKAATVADKYAKWDAPPGRYVVYVAGPDEWSQWYGTQQAAWVAAYAMPLTDTYTEIVLNATKVSSYDAREVLQHEFAHVVTLSGVRRTYPSSWWLIEGMAEYVQNAGRSVAAYRALGDGRKFVRGGTWNGSVALDEPPASASASDANGRYAVAYLSVRRLVDRFGEPKMLNFFAAVARNGTGLEAAATSALGQPWAQVSADCAAFVRRSVGVGDRGGVSGWSSTVH